MRLDALYRNGTQKLKEAGVPEAELDARYLLEEAAGITRMDLYVHPDREIDKAEEEQYLDWIEKRAERIPLQRILGVQEFMGLSFLVGEQVLIPRQDTETLVEQALTLLDELPENSADVRVLDMCTGTGCIAWSIAALSRRALQVTAVDISEEAVEVAMANRERLGLDPNRAHVLRSDLFEQVEGGYDMIVSNPPYIRPDVIETLEPEVRVYDPRLALDGGPDGMEFYRLITERSLTCLNSGGYLLYEIGYDQGEEVAGILRTAGFEEVNIIPDLAGLNRVVMGRKL